MYLCASCWPVDCHFLLTDCWLGLLIVDFLQMVMAVAWGNLPISFPKLHLWTGCISLVTTCIFLSTIAGVLQTTLGKQLLVGLTCVCLWEGCRTFSYFSSSQQLEQLGRPAPTVVDLLVVWLWTVLLGGSNLSQTRLNSCFDSYIGCSQSSAFPWQLLRPCHVKGFSYVDSTFLFRVSLIMECKQYYYY